MDANDSTTIGPIVVDIQIVRRAAFAPPGDPALRPPEDRARLRAAEQRLQALNGLELVKLLIEYTRATGTRLKI